MCRCPLISPGAYMSVPTVIFWYQNDFFCLSASRNHNSSKKICENNTKKTMIFYMFSANNIDFLTLRDRKHHFDIKRILETCSGTSNYLWDVISWPYDMYWEAYGRRLQKKCEKNQNAPFQPPFFLGGGY